METTTTSLNNQNSSLSESLISINELNNSASQQFSSHSNDWKQSFIQQLSKIQSNLLSQQTQVLFLSSFLFFFFSFFSFFFTFSLTFS